MSYTEAKQKYAALGVDTEAALDKLKTTPVSLHCWQGDDVRGFDTDPTKPLTGGIQTTGSYPGRAMIPLDGRVTGGEAMVNQSSMTGESLPVRKTPGSYAYAGTVVEEGECLITVEKTMGGGRYDRIVRMIEESEKLKSTAEDRASRLADRLVPYTLGGTALVWLFTRNITKTLAVLMVDFSCALKLAMPIAVLSAMRESNARHMSVKGGRFLEAVAKADTIVFDKTGTLTYAQPRVAEVVTFGGRREDDMLRLAACLEEHYPHSLANAVVEEARVRGLNHEEYHSSVEYVVAHGI